MPALRANGNRNRRLFRLAAMFLGLSPLIAFEGACHLLDWGQPALHDDPFVGFRSVRPLFVLSEDGSRYEIPQSRQAFFCPESFPAHKGDDEFRIFCLGGSTVQGRPFATETSFTSWLEISLNAARPERHWDVINCGGVSYASYRLIPILKEVLSYKPDLILLCTGHNEFLEARSFDHLQGRGAIVNSALSAVSSLRTFSLIREQYLRARGKSSSDPPEGRPLLPTEVEALLDYQNGLEEYRRDDAWRRGVEDQFRFNLTLLVQTARAAGVDILLVNPVSNLRDCPPFKSLHRDDLTEQELREWERLCRDAAQLMAEGVDRQGAIDCLEKACQIDPEHAGGFYHLGQCYLRVGRLSKACESLEKARELDLCPLRILHSMNETVLDVARRMGVPVVDAQALFESHSRDGIVGSDWLVDHIHPSIPGHQLLADTLADQMVQLGMLAPCGEWHTIREQRYHEHLAALPDLYFLKGMQQLESLQNWAKGRATQRRPASSR